MKSSPEGDLGGQYRQFLRDHSIRRAALAGGQEWTWIDAGAGPQALLLLPGLMGEAETSFLYIQALAPALRVISVSHPPGVGQVGAFCDGLAALLDHLRLPRAAVLGGSSGGLLAQAFLRRHSARVSALILTHTGLPDPRRARTARQAIFLLRGLPFRLARGLLRLAVWAYFPGRGPAQSFWRGHFRAIFQRLSRSALLNRFALMDDVHSRVRFQPGDVGGSPARILLMEMRRDHLSDAGEQAALRALYPAAQLRSFASAGHFDAVENPAEQIGVIREFLLSRPADA